MEYNRFIKKHPDSGKQWQLWRYADSRYLSGEYNSRAEAERGKAMLERAFRKSRFEIEFTGRCLGIEGGIGF